MLATLMAPRLLVNQVKQKDSKIQRAEKIGFQIQMALGVGGKIRMETYGAQQDRVGLHMVGRIGTFRLLAADIEMYIQVGQ